jgi:hypothetical protein
MVRSPSSDEEELWVGSAAHPDKAMRIRRLDALKRHGAQVIDARLVEAEDGTWTTYFSLADRPGIYRLNQARADLPKVYKDLRLALETLRSELGYYGAVVLLTDRRGGAASVSTPDHET